MLRLAKYLKPFAALVVASVALLFVQAVCDLSLPNYMSDIVNIGIQQSGVQSAVPAAIRQSEMNRLFIFNSADEKTRILSDYTLVDSNSADYAADLKLYPALANGPIYTLNTISQAEQDYLNTTMGKSLVAVYGIEQIQADPSKAAAFGQSGNASALSKLPPGTDLFAMLENPLFSKVLAPVLTSFQTKFAAMGTSMIVQSAATAIKAEYAALGMDMATLENNYIIHIGLLMLVISLVSGSSMIVVGLLSARAAAGIARNLRRDVFRKVESFSGAEIDKFSTASLITRSTNDVTQLQTVTMIVIRMVIYAPIMATGGVILALQKSLSMSWIIALAVVVLVALIGTILAIVMPRFTKIQKLVDQLNRVARENLSGIMVVRAFNTQRFEESRFDKANNELTSLNLFVNRVMSFMMPAMMLIMNGVTVAIIWFGAHQVAESKMQVGDMIAFMQYGVQIVMSFLFMSFLFVILPRAAVSAGRIADVLETELSIKDPVSPKPFPAPFKGTVEFRKVSFRYPAAEEDVLHDISFTAQPGQTTAFIGSTGAGKSTLINLIPRFYDVTGGQILIDGIDIREVSQENLRDKLGYIPQKGMLFSGTIESNLRYADEDASEAALSEASLIAQAAPFIAEKPEGMKTAIAQGGTNVSGGQRQRLSIARALVKKPPIYIFDDSFSALDFKTDAALRHALKEKITDSVVLIVAQRISTIKTAEQIIVLDEGRIVGIGTHYQLMDTCETYREIATSQLSVEELA
jgi:ATP-binding cassette subfamily B protein